MLDFNQKDSFNSIPDYSITDDNRVLDYWGNKIAQVPSNFTRKQKIEYMQIHYNAVLR